MDFNVAQKMPGSYLIVLVLHMNNLHSEVEYIVYVLSVCICVCFCHKLFFYF